MEALTKILHTLLSNGYQLTDVNSYGVTLEHYANNIDIEIDLESEMVEASNGEGEKIRLTYDNFSLDIVESILLSHY